MLTMPEPAPVALFGDLLATQAKVRGAVAVLVDAAVRDSEDLAGMGLPVWTRWIRSRGATKDVVGELDVPVTVGGAADPARRPRRARRRRRDRRRRRARRRGARGLTRARGEGGGQAREAAGGRAVLRPRRPARRRRGPSERHRPPRARRAVHAHRRGEPALLRRDHGHGDRAPGGRRDVPARLGRLPALVAEADRVGHVGDGRPRPARLEPRGPAAPRRRGRGDRARRGLGRRRPRTRPAVPLPRPGRPPLRALLRVRALRARRRT